MASNSEVSGEAEQRPPLRAAIERAHPLALAAWQVLRDRSEADRRLVFDACHRRLESPDSTEQQALALHALESFKARFGHAPTRRQYDSFRSAQPDKRDWPSATFIRKAFGSWPEAQSALGEPDADALVLRLSSTGRSFSRDEAVSAVKRWAANRKPPLRLTDFQAWCEDRRLNDGEHLPLSRDTLLRLFGSWPGTLAAAGLASETHSQLGGVESAAGFDLNGVPATLRRTFSRDELLAWLAYMENELGRRRAATLSQDGFDALAQSVERLVAADGRAVYVPRSFAHTCQFGSWPGTKLAAGWLVAEEAIREPSRERYTDDELLNAVEQAIEDLGPRLTRDDYRSWRAKRLSELAQDDPRARIPSEPLLRRRLGGGSQSWDAAMTDALARLGSAA